MFPTEFAHTAVVEIAALKEAVQRVALVATKESPLRLTIGADNIVLEAGTQDEAQALDNVATTLEGDGEISLAFNAAFLLDGLNALTGTAVEFQIVTSTKPVVLHEHGGDDQPCATCSCRSASTADHPLTCGAAVDTRPAAPQRHHPPREACMQTSDTTARPAIVVLCGSTRFWDALAEANLYETAAGRIVLAPGCDMKRPHPLWANPEQADRLKAVLGDLHLKKIDLADEVLVVNPGGYIGDSTRGEIAYATHLGKPIRYTHQETGR